MIFISFISFISGWFSGFPPRFSPQSNPPMVHHGYGCIRATRAAAFLDEPRHGVDPGRVAAALAVPAPLAMPWELRWAHRRCDEFLFDDVLFK